MVNSTGTRALLICPLAHSLLDKLTVVVGYCDLLLEKDSMDATSLRHVRLILQSAQSMAVELHNLQCEHAAQTRLATAAGKRMPS